MFISFVKLPFAIKGGFESVQIAAYTVEFNFKLPDKGIETFEIIKVNTKVSGMIFVTFYN